MIERKDIEPLKNDFVAVGVPHDIIPDRLFFYYGTLTEINNSYVKIELPNGNGYKLIPINDIHDIQKRRQK